MNRLDTDNVAPRQRLRRLTRITAFAIAASAATVAMAWMAWPIGMWSQRGSPASGPDPLQPSAPLMLAASTTATAELPDFPEETPSLASRLTSTRILGICGMSPDLLAASGVTSGELSAVFADLTNNATTDKAAFAQAIQTQSTAKANVARLQKLVSSPAVTQEDRANLVTAQAMMATANSAIESLRSETYSRVLGAVNAAKVQKLSQAIANRRLWHLPSQYLMVDRTEAQWVQLRDALAERRVCAAKSLEVPQETTEFLAVIESDPAVQAAVAALSANATTVMNEWRNHDTR